MICEAVVFHVELPVPDDFIFDPLLLQFELLFQKPLKARSLPTAADPTHPAAAPRSAPPPRVSRGERAAGGMRAEAAGRGGEEARRALLSKRSATCAQAAKMPKASREWLRKGRCGRGLGAAIGNRRHGAGCNRREGGV